MRVFLIHIHVYKLKTRNRRTHAHDAVDEYESVHICLVVRACIVYAHMWVLFNSFKQTTYETSNVFLTGIHSRGPDFGSVVLTVRIARRHTHMRLFNTNLEIFWVWMNEVFFYCGKCLLFADNFFQVHFVGFVSFRSYSVTHLSFLFHLIWFSSKSNKPHPNKWPHPENPF